MEAVEALLAGFQDKPPPEGLFQFPLTMQSFGSWSGLAQRETERAGVWGSVLTKEESTSASLAQMPTTSTKPLAGACVPSAASAEASERPCFSILYTG